MLLFLKLQVTILQHASGSINGEGRSELKYLRMAVLNSVLDPWIYILFRKEVLLLVITALERLTGKQFQINRGLTGPSDTADSNKMSATDRATPSSETFSNRTPNSNDAEVLQNMTN
jgi:hypothetical protein